jgi:hypothetical protein
MAYTQAQLDAFWARYVVMEKIDVVQLTNPSSAAYEPDFAGMLSYVRQNRLYGFANYSAPAASNMSYTGIRSEPL